jgi:hypothetical protein
MRQRYQISQMSHLLSAATPGSLLVPLLARAVISVLPDSHEALAPFRFGLTWPNKQGVAVGHSCGERGSHPELPCCQRANMLLPPPSLASHF